MLTPKQVLSMLAIAEKANTQNRKTINEFKLRMLQNAAATGNPVDSPKKKRGSGIFISPSEDDIRPDILSLSSTVVAR